MTGVSINAQSGTPAFAFPIFVFLNIDVSGASALGPQKQDGGDGGTIEIVGCGTDFGTGARGALLTSTVLIGDMREDQWAVFEYTRVGPLTLGPGETCGIQIKGNVEIRCQGVFSPGAKVCGIFEPGAPPPKLRLRAQGLSGSVDIDLSSPPDFVANGGSVYLMAGSLNLFSFKATADGGNGINGGRGGHGGEIRISAPEVNSTLGGCNANGGHALGQSKSFGGNGGNGGKVTMQGSVAQGLRLFNLNGGDGGNAMSGTHVYPDGFEGGAGGAGGTVVVGDVISLPDSLVELVANGGKGGAAGSGWSATTPQNGGNGNKGGHGGDAGHLVGIEADGMVRFQNGGDGGVGGNGGQGGVEVRSDGTLGKGWDGGSAGDGGDGGVGGGAYGTASKPGEGGEPGAPGPPGFGSPIGNAGDSAFKGRRGLAATGVPSNHRVVIHELSRWPTCGHSQYTRTISAPYRNGYVVVECVPPCFRVSWHELSGVSFIGLCRYNAALNELFVVVDEDANTAEKIIWVNRERLDDPGHGSITGVLEKDVYVFRPDSGSLSIRKFRQSGEYVFGLYCGAAARSFDDLSHVAQTQACGSDAKRSFFQIVFDGFNRLRGAGMATINIFGRGYSIELLEGESTSTIAQRFALLINSSSEAIEAGIAALPPRLVTVPEASGFSAFQDTPSAVTLNLIGVDASRINVQVTGLATNDLAISIVGEVPPLTVAREGAAVTLSWNAQEASNFQLQFTPDISSGTTWQSFPLLNPLERIGEDFVLPITNLANRAFFRLQRPLVP